VQGKIIGSLVAAVGFAAVIAVFAIPAIPGSPARVATPAVASATSPSVTALSVIEEHNVRGVVEMIDTSTRHIRVSGKDYTFLPEKVKISDKSGKLSVSALRVGTHTQCVVTDDGATQSLTEVWVET
jgi:hypothetical protein